MNTTDQMAELLGKVGCGRAFFDLIGVSTDEDWCDVALLGMFAKAAYFAKTAFTADDEGAESAKAFIAMNHAMMSGISKSVRPHLDMMRDAVMKDLRSRSAMRS